MFVRLWKLLVLSSPLTPLRRRRAQRRGCWRSLETLEARAMLSGNTIVVTTNSDAMSHTGKSLRDAIAEADGDSPGDTITFSSTLSGDTITLTQGELAITNSLTITGLGANQLTISGNNNSRIFDVDANDKNAAQVTITGLTLTDGNGSGANQSGAGGAIYNIENLTLAGDNITENSGNGGGIYNDTGGTVTSTNDTISDNSGSDFGGGVADWGASFRSTDDTITGNSSTYSSGGVWAEGSNVDIITGDTITGNKSESYAGGIGATGGNLYIADSIVAGNTAAENADLENDSDNTTVLNSLIGVPDGDTLSQIFVTSSGTPVLANNGGPTPTVALTNSSTNPALEAGGALTTLSLPMTTGATTATVNSTAYLAVGDTLRIGGEIVTITGVDATNDTLELLADQDGTTDAGHASGTGLYLAFDQRGMLRATPPDLGAYEATPLVAVTDAGGTYNGSTYPATATVDNAASLEGVTPAVTYYSGAAASGTALSGTPSTAGTYSALASFAGSTDYSSGASSTTFTITQATPSVSVSDAGGTYNGSPYGASATVTGNSSVAGSSLEGVTPTLAYYSGTLVTGSPLSSAPSTAGTYTVVVSFAGSTDYTSAVHSTSFTIAQATPTVSVSDSGGAYTGSAYPATDSVAGINHVAAASLEGVSPSLTYYSGSSASGTPLGGAPTAVGTYTALASFAGSTDYTSASASATFTITPPVITFQNERVTGGHVAEPLTLSGLQFTSTGTQGGKGLQFQGTGDGWPATVLASEYAGTVINMTRAGGGTFTLYSLVLDSFLTADSAVVTGYNAAGAKLDQQIVAFTYPKGSISATSTVTMDWTGLSKITITWWSKANGTGQIEDGGLQSVSAAPAAVPVPAVAATPWQNPVEPLDVVGQGGPIVPLDALDVINYLNANPGNFSLPSTHPAGSPYLDVIGDNAVVPLDALEIIDYLNANPSVAAAPAVSPAVTTVVSDTTSPASAAPATSSNAAAPADPVAVQQSTAVPASVSNLATPVVSPAVMAVNMLSSTSGNPAAGSAAQSAANAEENSTPEVAAAVGDTSATNSPAAPAIDVLLTDSTGDWWNE